MLKIHSRISNQLAFRLTEAPLCLCTVRVHSAAGTQRTKTRSEGNGVIPTEKMVGLNQTFGDEETHSRAFISANTLKCFCLFPQFSFLTPQGETAHTDLITKMEY